MYRVSIESLHPDGKSRLLATALIEGTHVVLSQWGAPKKPWRTGNISKRNKNGASPWDRVRMALAVATGGK